VEWAKCEILRSGDFPWYDHLSEIYATTRGRSDRAAAALLGHFAQLLEAGGDRTLAALADVLTFDILLSETVHTKFSDVFIKHGLRELESDVVAILLDIVCEEAADCGRPEGRLAAQKAALILTARPDLKEDLVGRFAITDRAVLWRRIWRRRIM
jgi:hypothetical protein